MRTLTFILFFGLLISCSTKNEQKEEALASWQNNEIKTEIISFVKGVIDPASDQYVPVEDRIAVFDNDGTLWTEKPNYIPVEYEIAWLKSQIGKDPSLLDNDLVSALINQDKEALKSYDTFTLIKELFGLHKGESETDYYLSGKTFLDTARHNRFNRLYKELTFKPVVELVHYLQQNRFNVFIVTGGEITFTRTISEEIYGIPPENVIGSNVKYEYISNASGTSIIRLKDLNSINDKQFKPVNINLHIGKKPIFAVGNSDGDYEMMEYTLSGTAPSMALLIHHDDEDREYSYTHGTEKALADADSLGWKVVSMKQNFQFIF